MQFSKNWLNDFIDIDLSTEDICAQLTMAGLEVDGFENINSKITGQDSIIKLDITPNRGCLLYTSPSPRDATLSRMPSSA